MSWCQHDWINAIFLRPEEEAVEAGELKMEFICCFLVTLIEQQGNKDRQQARNAAWRHPYSHNQTLTVGPGI